MSVIKELSFDEISLVSGGNANGNFERRDSYSSNSHSSSNGGGAPDTRLNRVGMAIIEGTLTGIASVINPLAGVAVGTAFAAAEASRDSGSGGNSGNYGHDTDPGGVAGQCTW